MVLNLVDAGDYRRLHVDACFGGGHLFAVFVVYAQRVAAG